MSTFCGVIWIMYTLRSFKAPMVHLSPGWTEGTEKKDQGKLKSLGVKERDRRREKLKAATLIWMPQCVLLPMQNRTHQQRHRNSPNPPHPLCTISPLLILCQPALLGTEVQSLKWHREEECSLGSHAVFEATSVQTDSIRSLCSSEAGDKDAVYFERQAPYCVGKVFKNCIFQNLVQEVSPLTSSWLLRSLTFILSIVKAHILWWDNLQVFHWIGVMLLSFASLAAFGSLSNKRQKYNYRLYAHHSLAF